MTKNSILFSFLCFCIFWSCNNQPKEERIDLSENWEIKRFNDTYKGIKIPFSSIPFMYEHQIIDDPMMEDNINDLKVFPDQYIFTKNLHLSEKQIHDKNIILQCDQVNGRAEFFLNGHKIGTSSDYLSGNEFDISKFAFIGDNSLQIKFINDYSSHLYAPYQQGNFVGIPTHQNFGIFGDISLLISDKIRTERGFLQPEKFENNQFIAQWLQPIYLKEDGKVDISLKIGDQTFENKLDLKKGRQLSSVPFEISNPIFWEPKTLKNNKKPKQYKGTLKISFDGDLQIQKEITFGLKYLKWENNNNQISFNINGKKEKVFAIDYAPENWTKPDDKEAFKRQILNLQKYGVNCLRVDADFGILSNELLETADEEGILIWQDLPFNRLESKWDVETKLKIEDEIGYITELYRNHPSVLSLGAINHSNHKDSLFSLIEYEVYEQILPKYIRTLSRLEYIPNSHIVWNDNSNKIPELMAFSSFDYLGIWTREKKRDPYGPTWESKWNLPFSSVSKYYDHIFEQWNEPTDIEYLFYYSELNQAKTIEMLLQEKKAINPNTIHLPIFLKDTWPGLQPSLETYFGKMRKSGYQLLADKPNIEKTRDDHYYLHNPTDKDIETEVVISFKTPSGETISSYKSPLRISQHSSQLVLEYNEDLIPENWKNTENGILEIDWQDDWYREVFNWNEKTIPNPNLLFKVSKKGNQHYCNIIAENFVAHCELKSDKSSHFGKNFFHMLPGDTLEIPIYPLEENMEFSNNDIRLINYFITFGE
jgi:hypothetical protein